MTLQTPRQVLFRQWAIDVHQPRTAAAAALIRFLARDTRFAPAVGSRKALAWWLKNGPRMPADVRAAAPAMWQGYAAWRRARAARVPATAPGEAAGSDLAAAAEG